LSARITTKGIRTL